MLAASVLSAQSVGECTKFTMRSLTKAMEEALQGRLYVYRRVAPKLSPLGQKCDAFERSTKIRLFMATRAKSLKSPTQHTGAFGGTKRRAVRVGVRTFARAGRAASRQLLYCIGRSSSRPRRAARHNGGAGRWRGNIGEPVIAGDTRAPTAAGEARHRE